MKINFKNYLKTIFKFLDKRIYLLLILIFTLSLFWSGLIFYHQIYKAQISGREEFRKINRETYHNLTQRLERALFNVNQAMIKEYPDPFK